MKQAMIFAAGLGTRLRPITDSMPKALVLVEGKPLLEHVINRLHKAGFTKIVINVHHFAEQIVDYLEEKDFFGLDISISNEQNMLLETGGGIKKAQPLFAKDAPILIHNVDIFSNADLSSLYDSCQSDALLLVSNRETSRYLLFDDDMNLVGWTNISTGEIRSPYGITDTTEYHRLAFSGIHVFAPTLFPAMEDCPERFKIIDFYLQQCAKYRIKGVCQNSLKLIDVGKIDTLQQLKQQEYKQIINS